MLNRIIGIIILLLALATGGLYGYNRVKQIGYDEAKAEFAEASRAATKSHEEEIAKLNKMHETINKGTVASYETKLSDLDRKYRNVRGLRVSKAVCSSGSGQATSESSTGNNEAESVRLPENVERSLYDLVRKADEVNAQLSACQGWIRANKMD